MEVDLQIFSFLMVIVFWKIFPLLFEDVASAADQEAGLAVAHPVPGRLGGEAGQLGGHGSTWTWLLSFFSLNLTSHFSTKYSIVDNVVFGGVGYSINNHNFIDKL